MTREARLLPAPDTKKRNALIVELRDVYKISYSEIAQRFGISESLARKTYSKIKRAGADPRPLRH